MTCHLKNGNSVSGIVVSIAAFQKWEIQIVIPFSQKKKNYRVLICIYF